MEEHPKVRITINDPEHVENVWKLSVSPKQQTFKFEETKDTNVEVNSNKGFRSKPILT